MNMFQTNIASFFSGNGTRLFASIRLEQQPEMLRASALFYSDAEGLAELGPVVGRLALGDGRRRSDVLRPHDTFG